MIVNKIFLLFEINQDNFFKYIYNLKESALKFYDLEIMFFFVKNLVSRPMTIA